MSRESPNMQKKSMEADNVEHPSGVDLFPTFSPYLSFSALLRFVLKCVPKNHAYIQSYERLHHAFLMLGSLCTNCCFFSVLVRFGGNGLVDHSDLMTFFSVTSSNNFPQSISFPFLA